MTATFDMLTTKYKYALGLHCFWLGVVCTISTIVSPFFPDPYSELNYWLIGASYALLGYIGHGLYRSAKQSYLSLRGHAERVREFHEGQAFLLFLIGPNVLISVVGLMTMPWERIVVAHCVFCGGLIYSYQRAKKRAENYPYAPEMWFQKF